MQMLNLNPDLNFPIWVRPDPEIAQTENELPISGSTQNWPEPENDQAKSGRVCLTRNDWCKNFRFRFRSNMKSVFRFGFNHLKIRSRSGRTRNGEIQAQFLIQVQVKNRFRVKLRLVKPKPFRTLISSYPRFYLTERFQPSIYRRTLLFAFISEYLRNLQFKNSLSVRE